MNSPLEAYQVLVKGHVQGVGFRFFCLTQARRLHLTGWVKNLPSGEVSLHVEGTPSFLTQFMHNLTGGPGKVDALDAQPVDVQNYQKFRIHM